MVQEEPLHSLLRPRHLGAQALPQFVPLLI